ncbi:MAG: hypothetical protein GY949_01960 [Gammaproteobacteria bacterium]|nr:hypothetical protein [Gammaproteobacteria bacterium]
MGAAVVRAVVVGAASCRDRGWVARAHPCAPRHKDILSKTPLPQLPLLLCSSLLTGCASTDLNLDRCERLSGVQIERTFADVVDTAIVKDVENGRAINHWYSDGRFTSKYSSANGSGTVTGTWFVENNRRCVAIDSGLPDSTGHTTCSPLYRCDDDIVSLNADGNMHGVHRLEDL